MSSSSIRGARPAANVNAAVNTAQVFPDSVNVATACVLSIPGGGVLEQKKFIVRASGLVTSNGAFTVVITLAGKVAVPANPLTLANWTTLLASTARSVNTTSAPWWIEAELLFDSTSGKLQGVAAAMINNLYDAKAAVSNVITGVAGGVGSVEPALNFVVGVTFSTGDAANIGKLGDFVLDA